jgi:MFS family permease
LRLGGQGSHDYERSSNAAGVNVKNALSPIRRSLFLVSAPVVFITFALPLRAEDLGASAFEIGILYALFTISVFIVRPLVGIGLDKIGRRPFFIAATIFYLGANIFYTLSETVSALYVARLFQGLGFAVLAITTETITSDLTERDGRTAAMGGNIASQARGGMAGGFIGFGLVGALPLHAWFLSFTTFSIVSFFAVIYAFRIIPETLSHHDESTPAPEFAMPDGYRRVLAIVFFAAFSGAIIQPYYLIYLRGRFGLELYALAAAFLPIGIAYAVLPSWLGKITNRLKRTTAMSIGLALPALFYAAVPNMSDFYWVIAAFIASSIGGVLSELTKSAWIADLSGTRTVGRTFGLAALAAGAGAALGPLAGGIIYDELGGDYLFYFAGVVLLAALILTLAFRIDRDRLTV